MIIDNDGIDIHFESTGEGRPVVLLHGFPDSGRMWGAQVDALAASGFQVIVPDLRGYGSSGKPAGVEVYSLVHLAGDVLAVLDHLGLERAHVVGHDWGAALTWVMGSLVPDRVDHLVALSVGHPVAFRDAGFRQLELSWYIMFFQFEGVAERWLSDNSWANLRQWTHHPDIDAVIDDLEANGSLTPALELVPGQCGALLAGRPAVDPAAHPGAHHGGVEQRGLRAHRGPDDRVVRPRRRALALRAVGWARPLDAARGPRRRQSSAARLPPGLTPDAATDPCRARRHPGPRARTPKGAAPEGASSEGRCRTAGSVQNSRVGAAQRGR